MKVTIKIFFALFALFILSGVNATRAADVENGVEAVSRLDPVVVARYKGPISPVTVRYFERAMKKTWDTRAQALILVLDTPGGMMKPTRDIIQEMLSASYPVIVFVGPRGGRASSAGAFMVVASDVAVMAQKTNIGASQAANTGEKAIPGKSINDAADFMVAIAERKGRNVGWAEKVVRESVSAGEREALRLGVVDMIADDVDQLLDRLDGRNIKKEENRFLLKTKGAARVDLEMSWIEKSLLVLASPNVAYVLFLLGLYGLVFEVKTAGFGMGGILGVLCLALAFTSFETLPINYGGLALLSFGVVLFIAEAFVLSGGILGVGGAIVMLFGSFLLFGGDQQLYRVSAWLMILMVGISAGVFLWLIRDAVKVMRRQVISGKETLVGMKGVTVTDLVPVGLAQVDGEDWSAQSMDGKISAETQVKVVGIKGLKLIVESFGVKKKEKKEEAKVEKNEKENL